jgi:hypothetical protein
MKKENASVRVSYHSLHVQEDIFSLPSAKRNGNYYI